VAIAKQKRPGTRKIRKAIGQQLRYIRRDIGHIEKQVQAGALERPLHPPSHSERIGQS